MKSKIPPRIESPCPKSWSEMTGDAKRRFCDHCQLHVHNLSEMNDVERRSVLNSRSRQCVTFTVDSKGALVAPSPLRGLFMLLFRFRAAFIAIVAAIIPFGLASCTATRQLTGKPVPPTDKSDTKPAESPGKRYTTTGMIAPRDLQ